MDEIVKQAMAKWPNVPHCYGWLALDARGQWRMRDERAQALKLPGDKLTQPALVGFINRNYAADDAGRWFFQNGPQRVYVELEVTPYIARTAGAGFVLHTGEAAAVDAAWMTEDGALVLSCGGKIALLEDRDMAEVLGSLQLDGATAGDEAVMAWLQGAAGTLCLGALPIARIKAAELDKTFHFQKSPAP